MEPINPVDDIAFVGIDPNDTVEVPYGGGIFKLGVLPVGLWDRLATRSSAYYYNAIRRTTAAIAARGENPEQEVIEGKGVTLLTQEIFKDPVYTAEQSTLHAEAAKYGVRGHQKFRNKKGEEFPCEFTQEKLEGVDVQVLNKRTMEIYRANPDLLRVLWFAMRQLHDLPVSAKKA